jgi:hypothetical protein
MAIKHVTSYTCDVCGHEECVDEGASREDWATMFRLRDRDSPALPSDHTIMCRECYVKVKEFIAKGWGQRRPTLAWPPEGA